MAQRPEDFIALANRTVHFKFSGDPLALDSFIDAVKLLDTLCEANNKAILVKFIMTRLEGEAREAIETEPANANSIITQLKERIKTESSKVIEGRILALRTDKSNLTKFSERAEELAEQYRRSLYSEGFSKEKAKEIAIEKTVDLCRKSARSDTVKAVLAASKFSEPKEVIAKMIVEINNLKLDRNDAQYNHKNKNNHAKNGNNKFSNSNNKHFHRNSNNNRNSESSTSQNSNTNRHNWHNNGNSNRGSRSNNNQSRTFYNSNNSNNGRRYEQSVRLYSGNEMNPGNGGQTTEQSQ